MDTWASTEGAGVGRQTTVGIGELISSAARAAWTADGSASLQYGGSNVQGHPASWAGRFRWFSPDHSAVAHGTQEIWSVRINPSSTRHLSGIYCHVDKGRLSPFLPPCPHRFRCASARPCAVRRSARRLPRASAWRAQLCLPGTPVSPPRSLWSSPFCCRGHIRANSEAVGLR